MLSLFLQSGSGFKTLLLTFSLAFLSKLILPEPFLICLLFTLMAVDFLIAVVAAWTNKVAITSRRMRESAAKVVQYLGAIVLIVVITNFSLSAYPQLVEFSIGSAYSFLAIVEAKSLAENIKLINPESAISRNFLTPLLSRFNAVIEAFKNPKNNDNA